ADGLQPSHRPGGTDVRRVFRAVEAHTDVALGGQIVDFVRLNLSDQPGQRAGVAQIAIVQKQPGAPRMRVVVNRIQAPRIESAGPPNNAVHFVSFGQQQLRQVGPVLSGNSGNERFLSHRLRLRDLKSSRTMASPEKSRYPQSLAPRGVPGSFTAFPWSVGRAMERASSRASGASGTRRNAASCCRG